MKLPDFWCP